MPNSVDETHKKIWIRILISTTKFIPFYPERVESAVKKMVEDTTFTISIRPRSKTTTRPKAVYFWAVHEVEQWFRRHCTEYNDLYGHVFAKHDVTGRALIRMNDNSLMRLGITSAEHRQAIWREILKLRLKNDIMEIRDYQPYS